MDSSVLDTAIEEIQNAGAVGVLTFPNGLRVTFGEIDYVADYSSDQIAIITAPYGEPEDFPIPRKLVKYDWDDDADTPLNRLVLKAARDRQTFLAIRLGAEPITTATAPDGGKVAVYVGDVMTPGSRRATDREASESFERWAAHVAYTHRNPKGSGVGFRG